MKVDQVSSAMSVPPRAWEVGVFVSGVGVVILDLILSFLLIRENNGLGDVLRFLLKNILWCVPMFAFGFFLRNRRTRIQSKRDTYLVQLQKDVRSFHG